MWNSLRSWKGGGDTENTTLQVFTSRQKTKHRIMVLAPRHPNSQCTLTDYHVNFKKKNDNNFFVLQFSTEMLVMLSSPNVWGAYSWCKRRTLLLRHRDQGDLYHLRNGGNETKVRWAQWYVPVVPELKRLRKEVQLSLGTQRQSEQHKGH